MKPTARPLGVLLGLLIAGLAFHGLPAPGPAAGAAAPVSVYGAWHCSNDMCLWGTARTVAEFDAMNHWIVDRGDGKPSVNLVVLSFVQPDKLLRRTTDATTLNGVPRGMTSAIVDYFTSHGIRVMLSIGGITYVKAWDSALAADPALLGQRAAALATALGVGIEIDYENAKNPNLAGLQAFISAYRGVHPYDATGADPTARLTIDLAAGDRWLIDLTRKATADWLRTDVPVLDYANAMVPSKQPSVSGAIANWQEHIDGKPQYAPPIPPLAPAKFTGSVYLTEGSQVRPECNNFAKSLQSLTSSFVTTVASKIVGTTSGMLGYMFWAAEKPASRGVTTQPPNTCEGGVGVGSSAFSLTWPMGSLRQH
jgi:hypothetical protein